MDKIYKIRDTEDGSIYKMTLPQILEELNHDRPVNSERYDSTDWREGLSECTTYEVIT